MVDLICQNLAPTPHQVITHMVATFPYTRVGAPLALGAYSQIHGLLRYLQFSGLGLAGQLLDHAAVKIPALVIHMAIGTRRVLSQDPLHRAQLLDDVLPDRVAYLP